jgi:hypothetical protein
VLWKVETSKVVASSVSVKDQWVGTHEYVSNVLVSRRAVNYVGGPFS